MQDKTNILEEAVKSALSHLGEIRRIGDLEIDPSQTAAGIWVSVKSEEPVCNRQRLTVTFYVRTHADSDPERKRIDALSSTLVQASPFPSFLPMRPPRKRRPMGQSMTRCLARHLPTRSIRPLRRILPLALCPQRKRKEKRA